MERSRRSGLTRRQLVAGGGAAVLVLLGGAYGRFALADEFEEHVADVLGVPMDVARRFTANARDHFGQGEYDVRAAGFVAATTFPGSLLHPEAIRGRSVGGFVRAMMDGTADNLAYLGLQRQLEGYACNGLIRA
ncbi:MAG: hypothetical protein ACJ76V_13715 [Thermoleophilaceae bacterium]